MKHFLSSLALALSLTVHLFAQGNLTPPGAPAPTMKTLDQIEARTPISSLPFTISAPGSYYLTANLAAITTVGGPPLFSVSATGITVSADNVTIDLNGFALSTTSSASLGAGISISGTRKNITIKNGHIGSRFGHGVDGLTGTNVRVTEVSVLAAGAVGIRLDRANPTHFVERCIVKDCVEDGITAGFVKDCVVSAAGANGIAAISVLNSIAESVGNVATANGIESTSIVENSKGTAAAGAGISGVIGSDCQGTSNSGTGISLTNATNCRGTSNSGVGLSSSGATHCSASTTSGSVAMQITNTASFCTAQRTGGTALSASIAIGCTVTGGGIVTATNKFLGTP